MAGRCSPLRGCLVGEEAQSEESRTRCYWLGGWIDSLKAAHYFEEQPMEVIQTGYDELKDGVFRIPQILSFDEGSGILLQAIQIKYTMGTELIKNSFHTIAVRTSLTRNLGKVFPEVRDEIECAMDDVFALHDDDWKLVPVIPAMMKVVSRTSNRLFVGLPLCRNETLVAPFIVTRMKRLREMLGFVGSIIEERIAKEDALGPNYEGKPNDLISWLLESAGPEGRHPEPLLLAFLPLIWLLFTPVRWCACAHPRSVRYHFAPGYLEPMREEAENVIRAEGWTKSALNSMHKIDSFIRETQRMQGNGPVAMSRKVIHPDGFTFSDGIKIPYGSLIFVPGKTVHYDPTIHKDPEVFNGSVTPIFGRLRPTITASRKGYSTATWHACPGRFFAATEIKAMLAHILINYDIKAEVPGVRPANDDHGMISAPNGSAGIFIRKRQL
ncbi:unnamed protein product [Mycena citricolor]|uniref:Cytochrome P450 n=1 Tax=Mycena citricolor TaxID=2018698 RepID=A0AAD2Q6U0_9AGAR|nr:unnamed protein product [Mycena citricolor]